jgi:nucleoside 2-deoxyribosyltransferase
MTDPVPGSPVYCSGPMFSAADLWQQQTLAATLQDGGYTTYLPQRDGIEVGRVMALINTPVFEATIASKLMLLVRQIVFALDMYQVIDRCQSIVFDMDGRVPDEGSVVEAATAFAAGKPLVIYKTTPITILGGSDNPMVSGLSSSWSYVNSAAAVPAALAAVITSAPAFTYTPPEHLQRVVDVGHAVWLMMSAWRAVHPSPTDKDLVGLVQHLASWSVQSPEFQAFPGGQPVDTHAP